MKPTGSGGDSVVLVVLMPFWLVDADAGVGSEVGRLRSGWEWDVMGAGCGVGGGAFALVRYACQGIGRKCSEILTCLHFAVITSTRKHAEL